MKNKRFAKEDDAGIIGFVVPITVMFFLVLLIHQLPKLGLLDASSPLLEPVFGLWIVFVGVLFAVCIFMRQFLVLFLSAIISFIVTVLIYVLYVIE